MKILFKIIIYTFLLSYVSGCSTFSDKIDLAGIIDSTENWLFKEGDSKDEEASEIITDETVLENEEEEVFPDISEIPQERQEYDELEKEFFETEKSVKENSGNSTEEKIENNEILALDNDKISTVEENNIFAVSSIPKNIRLKLVKLLIESDPPVDNNMPVISEDIVVNEIGTKVAIIQFPDDSVIPDESASNVINELVNNHKSKKIKLVGHASRTGSNTTNGKRYNMEISYSRAETIKKILIKKGFPPENIKTSGKGDLEPLEGEAVQYGEAVNRRVEIFFISK
tara:strand:- start:78 stop:932 length:855 start_codon:yes stop_codon:yes gene_type:complete